MRWLAIFFILSFPALAQEPQMAPVAAEHLKAGRFLFEWGSIESPPGTVWTYELNTPSDRWHYASLKIDRNHLDNTRVCNLYIFPPEPLDVVKAEDWFKLLLPEASPPKFTKASNPIRPSFWSPIQARNFRGTLVVTATPQAVFCWEELGRDSTPRDFPAWLGSFQPAVQKQTFENQNLKLSGVLPVQDGRIQADSGQFTPPEGTTWIQANLPDKNLEFYQGSRTSSQAYDVFAVALNPESHQLSTESIDAVLSGMGRTAGQKASALQVNVSDSQRISASFQLGGVAGAVESRLTAAGTALFIGYGPAVNRQEVVRLADSFQPSSQKTKESEDHSQNKANSLTFQIALFGGLFVSGLSGAVRKATSPAWKKFYRALTIGLPLALAVAVLGLGDRMLLDDRARGQLLGACLGVALVGVFLPGKRRNDSGRA